jgi:starch phosphorylase
MTSVTRTMRARMPILPTPVEGLALLATNLSWSWHRQARALFKRLDEAAWHRCRHNPITFLRDMEPARLEAAANDPSFRTELERVLQWMEGEKSNELTWFGRTYADLRSRPVAYFCAEFGLHNSVPIYSGGLGILAGDHCKAASDLGVPLVALGLFYQKGYFDQRIRLDGWQEDSDEVVDPATIPVTPLAGLQGAPHVAVIQTFGRPVYIRAWLMRVGRVPIYLLDTALEQNHEDDRALLNKLYGEGEDLRLRQEWILGAGGVRVIRALGIEPAVWHANEGHAAFMLLERVRELVAQGVAFEAAVAAVRHTSVFTTHTPVPAGHDNFDAEHVAQCIGPVWDELGVSREHFFHLAENPRHPGRFDMTALALRLSTHVNGVSRRHGGVSREMWAGLWPGRPSKEVPIGSITNGVHMATWMANEMMELLDKHLGPDWWTRLQERDLLEQIATLNDQELWGVHLYLRQVLFRVLREDARRRFADDWKEATQVVGAGALLDPNAFTIGFARRFATYKRADLIFRDPERLHRLLTSFRRPVQLVVAGKAHPADNPGKQVLQTVYRFTHDPFYEGRVAFVQDYGMYPAHVLVQGVDLWLNLPRVPMEASGTSGMKAALNGVPQLSTQDGWWEEGWDGTNGWTIDRLPENLPVEEADARDAEALYRLLEDEIVPLYYERDARGIPVGWVDRMRNAVRVAVSQFTAHRMLRNYSERYYVPAMRGDVSADDPPTA